MSMATPTSADDLAMDSLPNTHDSAHKQRQDVTEDGNSLCNDNYNSENMDDSALHISELFADPLTQCNRPMAHEHSLVGDVDSMHDPAVIDGDATIVEDTGSCNSDQTLSGSLSSSVKSQSILGPVVALTTEPPIMTPPPVTSSPAQSVSPTNVSVLSPPNVSPADVSSASSAPSTCICMSQPVILSPPIMSPPAATQNNPPVLSPVSSNLGIPSIDTPPIPPPKAVTPSFIKVAPPPVTPTLPAKTPPSLSTSPLNIMDVLFMSNSQLDRFDMTHSGSKSGINFSLPDVRTKVEEMEALEEGNTERIEAVCGMDIEGVTEEEGTGRSQEPCANLDHGKPREDRLEDIADKAAVDDKEGYGMKDESSVNEVEPVVMEEDIPLTQVEEKDVPNCTATCDDSRLPKRSVKFTYPTTSQIIRGSRRASFPPAKRPRPPGLVRQGDSTKRLKTSSFVGALHSNKSRDDGGTMDTPFRNKSTCATPNTSNSTWNVTPTTPVGNWNATPNSATPKNVPHGSKMVQFDDITPIRCVYKPRPRVATPSGFRAPRKKDEVPKEEELAARRRLMQRFQPNSASTPAPTRERVRTVPQETVSGFTTGSGKTVELSKDSLDRAKRIMEEEWGGADDTGDTGVVSDVDDSGLLRDISWEELSAFTQIPSNSYEEGQTAAEETIHGIDPDAIFNTQFVPSQHHKEATPCEDDDHTHQECFVEDLKVDETDSNKILQEECPGVTIPTMAAGGEPSKEGEERGSGHYDGASITMGFTTASNAPVSVKKSSLHAARSLMAEVESSLAVGDELIPVGEVGAGVRQERLSSWKDVNVPCFTTGSGRPVDVSKSSMKAVRSLFSEYDTTCDDKENLAVTGFTLTAGSVAKSTLQGTGKGDSCTPTTTNRPNVPAVLSSVEGSSNFDNKSFCNSGFTTARGTRVDISKSSLEAARAVLSEAETSSIEGPRNISDKGSFSCGFTTASDKPVYISKSSLEAARTVLSEAETSGSRDKGSFSCGFTTASDKGSFSCGFTTASDNYSQCIYQSHHWKQLELCYQKLKLQALVIPVTRVPSAVVSLQPVTNRCIYQSHHWKQLELYCQKMIAHWPHPVIRGPVILVL